VPIVDFDEQDAGHGFVEVAVQIDLIGRRPLAFVMPIPYGMAGDAQPQILSNPAALSLFRVQYTQQCRRDCDATYAVCLSEAHEIRRRGGSDLLWWG
jgi:hypothetical protein